MKSKIATIALFSFLFISCENGVIRKEKPKDLLEQASFESILWELYLIEGDVRSRLRDTHFDSLRTKTTAEVNALYEKYNLDHDEFMKNYAYYMQDPNLSAEMMKNIVDRLVELKE